MQEMMDRVFFDNTLRDYALVLGVVVTAFLFRRFLGKYVTGAFYRLFRLFGWKVDLDVFTRLILGPVADFLFLLITLATLSGLRFPGRLKAEILGTDTHRLLNSLFIAVLVVFFFRMLLRGIDYIAIEMEKKANLTSDLSDNQLIVFFKDFFKVVLMIAGLLAVLRFGFQQDITKLLAGLSLVGAAIALAARESLENLIASFIIFFDKPFITGELLKVNNITGTVERIGLRSTRIRTVEKTFVTVPNKQMVDSIVDNLSQRTQRRVETRLELDLRTDAASIDRLLAEVRRILEHPGITSRSVYLTEILADAYVVVCEYYSAAGGIDEFNALRQEVNLQVLRAIEQSGIRLAGSDREFRLRKA
jgi:MscS family membrane protein